MASKTAVRKKYQPHLDGQSSAALPLPVMRAPWADSTLSLLREERDSSIASRHCRRGGGGY